MSVDLLASVVRTLVPVGAGLVLTLAAETGLDLDSGTVTAAVTAAVTAGYYLAFRGLEVLAGRLRWQPLRRVAGAFLGYARPPEYPKSPDARLASLARGIRE